MSGENQETTKGLIEGFYRDKVRAPSGEMVDVYLGAVLPSHISAELQKRTDRMYQQQYDLAVWNAERPKGTPEKGQPFQFYGFSAEEKKGLSNLLMKVWQKNDKITFDQYMEIITDNPVVFNDWLGGYLNFITAYFRQSPDKPAQDSIGAQTQR